MKNKKLISLVIGVTCIGLVIVTTSLSPQREEKTIVELPYEEKVDDIPIISSDGNFMDYDNLENLKKNSELIIIAQANKNFEDREHINKFHETPEDKYQPKFLVEGITKTEVTIKDVLKQPEGEHYNEGETIIVIEPITIFEDNDKVKKIKTISNYQAIGTEDYMLFLKKNSYGEYGVINMNNGRFSLTNNSEFNTMKAQTLSKKEEIIENSLQHGQIKEAIFEKYNKEIQGVLNQK